MATSLVKDMASGAWGWVKGLLAGGSVGAIAGAAIGALAAAATGGLAFEAAILGAEIGGLAMGSIGAVAGATTHVARNHDIGKVPVEEAVAAAKTAFTQGRTIQHSIDQQEMKTTWAKQVTDERAVKAKTIDTGQRLHS